MRLRSATRTLVLPGRLAVVTLAAAVAALLTGTSAASAAITGSLEQPLGPDVSSWQHPGGAPIDWGAVAGAGQTFAFVKATEGGGYVNPYLAMDWAGIHAAGMARGAYHFARPSYPLTTAGDQARAFIGATGTMQQSGDLPGALDLEDSGGLGPHDLGIWVHTFLDTVRALTGTVPILYTYPYFWQTAMANDTSFASYPLWIANYTTASSPGLIGGWTSWTFWQYTSQGSLPGIPGPVDLSRYCCGASLAAFAHGGGVGLSAIMTKYASLGGAASFLGPVTSNEYAVRGGRAQDFTGGTIYWSAALGAHEVHGSIRDRYRALGGPSSALGLPTTDELPTADGVGRYNHFQSGSVYYSPATGAHAVQGLIHDAWAAQGWELGPLGYPITDELTTPDRIGRYNHFTGGSIYFTPATGAHVVRGSIRDTWAALGWERGPLGYPVTDELGTPDGIGRYNHFTGGSIYFSPSTGAHEVRGAIRAAWAAMGWETSPLGYPISNEFAVPGGAQSNFQRDALRWTASSNSVQEVSR